MKKTKSRFEKARRALLFWCLFIGVGAVAGAVGMLVAPDGSALGMKAMLPAFQVLPFADALFQDFVFPGIALLCVNGITNLLAALLIIRRKPLGITLGTIFGITLMLWITIQFFIFEFNFMSTAYFIFGIIQAATGYAAGIFYRQERFAQGNESYPDIGKNDTELVVYFSRMGYTRRVAMERADALGAKVFEITTPERTEGTLGFWWCGRFGMHGWPMQVAPIPEDLASYARVTICSPIWVFAPAGPVRGFCAAAKGRVARADYIFVHHQPWNYKKAAATLDSLLGIAHGAERSIACHAGKFRELPIDK